MAAKSKGAFKEPPVGDADSWQDAELVETWRAAPANIRSQRDVCSASVGFARRHQLPAWQEPLWGRMRRPFMSRQASVLRTFLAQMRNHALICFNTRKRQDLDDAECSHEIKVGRFTGRQKQQACRFYRLADLEQMDMPCSLLAGLQVIEMPSHDLEWKKSSRAFVSPNRTELQF